MRTEWPSVSVHIPRSISSPIAFFYPLANRVDNDPEHSIRVTTDIAFAGSDSTLTRSRLYSSPGGRLLASIFDAYGDVSFALEELITRYDYAIYVREAEVHVEVIPETRFAILTKVTADSVVSLGSTLNITSSLRVGRTEDREVELALSVPDTLSPGFYQLEVGSAALLGDDAFLFGPPPSFFGAEESLDDVFARLNKPDENVLLKARLTFLAPPLPHRRQISRLSLKVERVKGKANPKKGAVMKVTKANPKVKGMKERVAKAGKVNPKATLVSFHLPELFLPARLLAPPRLFPRRKTSIY